MTWIRQAFIYVLTSGVVGATACIGVSILRRINHDKNQYLILVWLKAAVILYLVPVIYVLLCIMRMDYANGMLIQVGDFFVGFPVYLRWIFLIANVIWFVGAVIQIIKVACTYLKLTFILRGNIPLEHPEWMELFEECCKRFTRRRIQVLQNDLLYSPIAVGIFRPCVILPYKDYSEKQLRIIFEHELNHIRNHDLIWKQLALLITWIHWFNPLSYRLLRDLNFQEEVITDLSSIAGNSFFTCREYAALLADMEDNNIISPSMTALCEQKNNIMRRIFIMSRQKGLRKTGRKIAIGSCLALVLVSVAPAYMISAKAADMQGEWIRDNEVLYDSADEYLDINIEYLGVADDGVQEIVVTYGPSLYSTRITLDYSIPANTRILYKYQKMTSGQQVSVVTSCSDTSATYRVGIKEVNDNIVTYTEGTGNIARTFTTNQDGTWCVIVQNMSDSKIDIVGSAIYPN